jgi:exopolysaccharide biosynthesis polyprenyl glycosylphosphotransferase
MLKENWRFVSRVEKVADIALICLAFILTYQIRSNLTETGFLGWQVGSVLKLEAQLAPQSEYLIVLIIAITGYLVGLHAVGAYSSMRLSSSWRLAGISIFVSVAVLVLLSATLFLLKLDLSRSFIAIFCFLVSSLLLAERYLMLCCLRYWRRRGKNFRSVAIVGSDLQAERIISEILRRPELGLKIVLNVIFDDRFQTTSVRHGSDPHSRVWGSVGSTRRSSSQVAAIYALEDPLSTSWFELVKSYQPNISFATIGFNRGVDEAEQLIRSLAVDEVIFTDIVANFNLVEELALRCAEQGVRTTIAADLFSFGMVKSGISYFAGMPLIHFQTPPGDRWELSLKRAIDIILSSLLLILLLPLMLLITVAIKLSGSGPVLFKQKRVGLNGRLFSLYKFRSMYPGAEEELEKLRPFNEMQGPCFKISNDPRITKVGRILRKYSLDELPQFWNVIRGDMSIVGPRPPVPGEVKLYERRERRRLSMRPGLTCTWQVSGRNKIANFNDWVKSDLNYIDNWSLALDLRLILKTIPVVLRGTGAK